MISKYVLNHQSNSNFKLILKKGKAIDEEELWEKKKDNIDDSLEEGEIEINNENNNQKEENKNDAASSYSSSSNSPTSDTESKESFKDTSKKYMVILIKWEFLLNYTIEKDVLVLILREKFQLLPFLQLKG